MKLASLQELYVKELQDLYSAENQILKALPKMTKAASSPKLQEALQAHLGQTKTHVERLDQVFERLDKSPKGEKCKGMEGLLAEGNEILEEDGEPSVLDAALIASAQRVEHYEMAGYGCVRTYANLLGDRDAASLFQKTLDEEKVADRTLTQIAEKHINPIAAEAKTDDDEATKKRRTKASSK